MKKIISVFVLSALLSNAADAQQQAVVGAVTGKNEINTKSADEFFLSEEQRKNIEGINDYYNKLNATLTESAGYSPEAIREKKKSLEAERLEKLRQVLKPEQFDQLMSADKIASFDPVLISKQIGLDDEQTQRLSELSSSLAEKENMIQRDNDMSPADKQKAMSYIQAERLENINKILTPDQMKKLATVAISVESAAPAAAPVKKAATVTPAKKSVPAAKPVKKG